MSNEGAKSDPSWQSGWEGWTDDEWKDPVRVELPDTTVQETSISDIPLQQHDILESSDTEAGYDTANENTTDAYETAHDTATDVADTDVAETYFSANEDEVDTVQTVLVDDATPTASPRHSPSPSSCLEAEIVSEEVSDICTAPEEPEIIPCKVDDVEAEPLLESKPVDVENVPAEADETEIVTETPEEKIVAEIVEQSEVAAPKETLFRDGCTIIETSQKDVVDVFDPTG